MSDLYDPATEGYEVLAAGAPIEHEGDSVFGMLFDSTYVELHREDAAYSSNLDADRAADREYAKRSDRWERQAGGRW